MQDSIPPQDELLKEDGEPEFNVACLSHLCWDRKLFQRPQQVMSRIAKRHPVEYFDALLHVLTEGKRQDQLPPIHAADWQGLRIQSDKSRALHAQSGLDDKSLEEKAARPLALSSEGRRSA